MKLHVYKAVYILCKSLHAYMFFGRMSLCSKVNVATAISGVAKHSGDTGADKI